MKYFTLVLSLMTFCAVASAQSINIERSGKKNMGVAGRTETDVMINSKVDASTFEPEFKEYTDESLEDFAKKMREREWSSEDTAWKRACTEDTKQSYERYMAAFPNGLHIAEARCKLIDANIEDVLGRAHKDLPSIKQTETDNHSPKSTILIENHTGYPLTIYYSGSDIRSVVIQKGKKASITVTNGEYKLAATVPPQHIQPYAGQTKFVGGCYEIGFWVVSR